MREVLRHGEITVEQMQGLYVPQATIFSSSFCTDTSAHSEASQLVLALKLISGKAPNANISQKTDAGVGTSTDSKAFGRIVDAFNRRFSNFEKYSFFLAELPNLS